MITHRVRSRRSSESFPRDEHLAWKLAEVAIDPVEVPAEYFSQSFIDLACRVGARIDDTAAIEKIVIYSNSNTHNFIGNGSGDPQKYDPNANRETLDHSLPYIFTVALQDRSWNDGLAYERSRVTRPDTVALWQKISTIEDPDWTRRYHDSDPMKKAFGGRVEITMSDGRVIVDEIAVPDAHPAGAHPFGRDEYVAKFNEQADGIIAEDVQQQFISVVGRLPELTPAEISALALPRKDVATETPRPDGIL